MCIDNDCDGKAVRVRCGGTDGDPLPCRGEDNEAYGVIRFCRDCPYHVKVEEKSPAEDDFQGDFNDPYVVARKQPVPISRGMKFFRG